MGAIKPIHGKDRKIFRAAHRKGAPQIFCTGPPKPKATTAFTNRVTLCRLQAKVNPLILALMVVNAVNHFE